MGNAWKGISEEKLYETQKALLKLGGLNDGDYRIRYIGLGDHEHRQDEDYPGIGEDYIQTIEIDNSLKSKNSKELPILVMLHGYGAGACIFYRVLKDLSQHFHVYAIDILGMGASSRPEFKDDWDVDQSEEFFLKSLKLWKERIGIKEKIYLAGHSMGGYISAVYSTRYPEEIKKLLLLSPVGMPQKPEEYDPKRIINRHQGSSKVFFKVFFNLWEKQFSPFTVLRAGGRLGTSALLNKFLKRRMKLQEGEHKEALQNYLHQILLRPKSSEHCIHTMFNVGAWAKKPLIERIPGMELEIAFFYGEFDWMDQSSALLLIQNDMIKGQIEIILESDHHLYMDNPTDLVQKMVKQTLGEQVAEKYLKEKAKQEEGKEQEQIFSDTNRNPFKKKN